MKHFVAWTLVVVLLMLIGAFCLSPAPRAQALPEYSAQVGQPCSTCHVSPSGGGSRAPRGQAWVAKGKPGEVPDLVEALDVLGVTLDVDMEAYTQIPEIIPPAQPMVESSPEAGEAWQLHQWLSNYDGN